MFDYTRLRAIEFFYKDRKFIRVYYQDGDLIKQSCYNDDDGWYTMPNDIVARDTRVYYLDKQGQTRLRVRLTSAAGDEGEWTDAKFPAVKPLQSTQLTAARTDEDNANIHVYYQDEDHSIRELKYSADDDAWYENETCVANALPGTGLSIITGGDGNEIRLFHQDSQNQIREIYSDTDTTGRIVRRIEKYTLLPGAGISAVAWNYGKRNFQIRVYSVGADNKIVAMEYHKEKGGWERHVKDTSQVILTGASSGQLSDIAAVRIPEDGVISVFYQPQRKIIGQYSVASSSNGRIPLGIPTTGLTGVDKARLEAERQQKLAAEKQHEEEEERKRQQKLKDLGVCPSGYAWVKEAGGYRCQGGGHSVTNAELGVAN
ncbi:hypothetical protein VTN96DRAFT_3122 [Rasamsonia emersonii]